MNFWSLCLTQLCDNQAIIKWEARMYLRVDHAMPLHALQKRPREETNIIQI